MAVVAESAPLYGEDGGYQGFASYVPPKNSLSRTGQSEDSLRASAGSPGKTKIIHTLKKFIVNFFEIITSYMQYVFKNMDKALKNSNTP